MNSYHHQDELKSATESSVVNCCVLALQQMQLNSHLTPPETSVKIADQHLEQTLCLPPT